MMLLGILYFVVFSAGNQPMLSDVNSFELAKRTENEWICPRCRKPAEGHYCARCGQPYERPKES